MLQANGPTNFEKTRDDQNEPGHGILQAQGKTGGVVPE
jgi:hypothetical protein